MGSSRRHPGGKLYHDKSLVRGYSPGSMHNRIRVFTAEQFLLLNFLSNTSSLTSPAEGNSRTHSRVLARRTPFRRSWIRNSCTSAPKTATMTGPTRMPSAPNALVAPNIESATRNGDW